jgi:hypothetical protein
MASAEQLAARNARLDELLQAVREWHERERARLEGDSTFMKSVLRGRTGSERLHRANTSQAERLASDDIDSFLAGT